MSSPRPARLALNLHQLDRSNLVAIVSRVGARVAGADTGFNDPSAGLIARGVGRNKAPKQSAAALMGISFFPVRADRIVDRPRQTQRAAHFFLPESLGEILFGRVGKHRNNHGVCAPQPLLRAQSAGSRGRRRRRRCRPANPRRAPAAAPCHRRLQSPLRARDRPGADYRSGGTMEAPRCLSPSRPWKGESGWKLIT